MAAGFSMRVTGGRQLARQLERLSDSAAGRVLGAAALAGTQPILNQAKVNVHKVTGTLASSLHPELVTTSRDYAEAIVGTDVEYAAREELGFVGADRLGRVYDFPGHPYLRPAFDEKSADAVREAGAALRDALRRVQVRRVVP